MPPTPTPSPLGRVSPAQGFLWAGHLYPPQRARKSLDEYVLPEAMCLPPCYPCETPGGPVLLVLGAGPPSTQGEGLKLQLPQLQPHLQPSGSVSWDSGLTWLHFKV